MNAPFDASFRLATEPAIRIPDPKCFAAFNDYLALAVRCGAAAGLSDRAIARHAMRLIGCADTPDITTNDLAYVVAQRLARSAEPRSRIIKVLCMLAVEVPGFPVDPDEIDSIARIAIEECAA